MLITVLDATNERERRVALTPDAAAKLVADGHDVSVVAGAGRQAGFEDARYVEAGSKIVDDDGARSASGVVLTIGPPGPGPRPITADHVLIGLLDPRWRPEPIAELAAAGPTILALELMPRITRAQSMDVLSSTATVVGTEAVLLAARRLPKMLPLMMTAAGTMPPANVLVLGAGVAGLQAIATARRLGAVVMAYDVRPAAGEQIRSLGAKAIDLGLDSGDSEDSGGYAKAQSDDFADRQRAALTPHVAEADVVITTAAIPGAASPLLVTTAMIEAMAPGSVVVDLAAERGGNCELTEADGEVDHHGVLILGPTDLASWAAQSASQMYATNVVTLLRHLDLDGEMALDPDDEITRALVVARDGGLIRDEHQTKA